MEQDLAVFFPNDYQNYIRTELPEDPTYGLVGVPRPFLVKSPSGDFYFARVGDDRRGHREYTRSEYDSLKRLDKAAPGLVPEAEYSGVQHQSLRPYILCNLRGDLDQLSPTSAGILGERLATEVHAYKGVGDYGSTVPVYYRGVKIIGSLYRLWKDCYKDLIVGVLSHLDSGEYSGLYKKVMEVIEKVVPVLLDPDRLQMCPALIHGDLVKGNTGQYKDGQPVIYNPASWYAHNEFDLWAHKGSEELPFDPKEQYHNHFPVSEPKAEYEIRSELYAIFGWLIRIDLNEHEVSPGETDAALKAAAESAVDDLLQMFETFQRARGAEKPSESA